jgi:EAL domain-containing protein (putative c-di-GMP-specific phosphodiesterase class I)
MEEQHGQFHFETIPPLEEKMAAIGKLLIKDGKLALISIDTQSLHDYQDTFDRSIYETVLYTIRSCFTRLCGSEIRKDDIIASNISNGKKYYIFLSKPREKRQSDINDLEKIAFRLQEFIYNRLFETFYPLTKRGPLVKVGYALTFYSLQLHEKSIIQNVIEEAEQVAAFLDLKFNLVRRLLLHDILLNQDVTVFFQPLVQLETRKIEGYEASVSGPPGSAFGSGFNLENYARETGFAKELGWVSRIKIIAKAEGLDNEKLLFFRIGSEIALDASVKKQELMDQIKKTGIDPGKIVFEIDERLIIDDPALFAKIHSHFPAMKYLAVINGPWTDKNDVLFTDSRIQFIRVGPEIVHDLPNNEENQRIVLIITDKAHRHDKRVIAAGINTREELEALLKYTADFGQGSLFAKPGNNLTEHVISQEYLEDTLLQKKLLLSIYLKRGRDYFSREDFDKAVLEFTKALEVDPRNVESFYYRGYSFCEEGAFSIAAKDLSKVREIDPEFAKSRLLEGRIAEKKGDKEKAIACYEEYVSKAGQSFDTDMTFAQSRIRALHGE